MAAKSTPSERWYRRASVPMAAIRRYARQVAEQFQPDKIILFGSQAYGTLADDSDVDILVIMPCRNQIDQACKIAIAFDPPFPLDLIMRNPHNMKWRLAEGDSFSREITSRGRILQEAPDAPLDTQSRSRPTPRKSPVRRKKPAA